MFFIALRFLSGHLGSGLFLPSLQIQIKTRERERRKLYNQEAEKNQGKKANEDISKKWPDLPFYMRR